MWHHVSSSDDYQVMYHITVKSVLGKNLHLLWQQLIVGRLYIMTNKWLQRANLSSSSVALLKCIMGGYHVYTPPRALRSADQLCLVVPKSRKKTRGDRAFSVVAPKLWNELPTHVKMAPTLDTFKSRLKTNFYSLAFNTAWELCGLCLSFIVFLSFSVFYLILWLPFICF